MCLRKQITTSVYKQGKRATEAYAYKVIILHSEFLGHIRLMKIGVNALQIAFNYNVRQDLRQATLPCRRAA